MRELSQHVLDVIENSIAAGASLVRVSVDEDEQADRLTIAIDEDGRGMDAGMRQRVGDPFFTTRTTRHVGLGIPLFRAAAQRCEGDLTISSQVGVGTQVRAEFRLSHIDRAPLGDMRGTLLTALMAQQSYDLQYVHRVNGRVFEFDTREIRQILGDVPLTHPQVREWLNEFLQEGFAELYHPSSSADEGTNWKAGEQDAKDQVVG